jgi:hypothetical protein
MALPIVYRSPENSNVATAKKVLKERAEEAARRREARLNAPVPNYICYATTAFKNWKPGDKVPACIKCGGLLHRGENHKCEGFKPKFVERTEETKQRWEAKREEIRETRRMGRGVFCTECGDLLEDPEDAQWHAEDHGGKAQRNHYAVDGEPDGDLDGYDDEPEEDYCEGDDDGYDCD